MERDTLEKADTPRSFGEKEKFSAWCEFVFFNEDSRYEFLSERLRESGYVKATDVNKLFHAAKSLEELEKAKEILARYE